MTAEWVRDFCPELAEWKLELLAQYVEQRIASERRACAYICDDIADSYRAAYQPGDGYEFVGAEKCATAIRLKDKPDDV